MALKWRGSEGTRGQTDRAVWRAAMRRKNGHGTRNRVAHSIDHLISARAENSAARAAQAAVRRHLNTLVADSVVETREGGVRGLKRNRRADVETAVALGRRSARLAVGHQHGSTGRRRCGWAFARQAHSAKRKYRLAPSGRIWRPQALPSNAPLLNRYRRHGVGCWAAARHLRGRYQPAISTNFLMVKFFQYGTPYAAWAHRQQRQKLMRCSDETTPRATAMRRREDGQTLRGHSRASSHGQPVRWADSGNSQRLN